MALGRLVTQPGGKIRTVFKRLETDAEFRRRVMAKYPYAKWQIDEYGGDRLDSFVAWNFDGMQRRIVEDER